MKELHPVNQNVLLDITEKQTEQRTAAGLIIPDTAREKQNSGVVVAISRIDDPEFNVGDTVIYKQYSGTEIEFDLKKYLIIQYSEILAKIVETEEI